jgi:hypothetical protein
LAILGTQHRSVGEADNANVTWPIIQKYSPTRLERVKLRLYDCGFVLRFTNQTRVALAGSTVDPRGLTVASVSKSNLPKVPERFYGRKQVLNIERWFAGL